MQVIFLIINSFPASSLFIHGFSTLYITLPCNRIQQLTELIEHTFNKGGSLYLACIERFLTT